MPEGIESNTELQAPINAPRPILIPGATKQFAATQTSSSMTIFFEIISNDGLV